MLHSSGTFELPPPRSPPASPQEALSKQAEEVQRQERIAASTQAEEAPARALAEAVIKRWVLLPACYV